MSEIDMTATFEQAFAAHVLGLADNGAFTQHQPERIVLGMYASNLNEVSIEDASAGHFLVQPELSAPGVVAELTRLFEAVIRGANTWLAMHRFTVVSGSTISLLSYDYASEVSRRKMLAASGLATAPVSPLAGW
jgi:hypothetical protein